MKPKISVLVNMNRQRFFLFLPFRRRRQSPEMKNSDMTTDLLTAVQTEPTITSSQVRCEETNLTKSLIDGTNATMAGLKLKNAENSIRINQQISVITTTSNEIEDQEKDTAQKEKSEKSKSAHIFTL